MKACIYPLMILNKSYRNTIRATRIQWMLLNNRWWLTSRLVAIKLFQRFSFIISFAFWTPIICYEMAELTAYEEVFHYLRDNKYSDSSNKDQKRNLRKRSQKFVLVNGVRAAFGNFLHFFSSFHYLEQARNMPSVYQRQHLIISI